jgi:hypothetical protein
MKHKKKAALMLTPLIAATVITGCGDSDGPINRDVYASQAECIQDWGDAELCTVPPKDDDDEYRRHNHGVYHPIFWGPTYYGSDRTVSYKGRSISPTHRSSSLPSYGVTSRSSSFARSSVSTPRSVSTGGFGSRGSSGGFGS